MYCLSATRAGRHAEPAPCPPALLKLSKSDFTVVHQGALEKATIPISGTTGCMNSSPSFMRTFTASARITCRRAPGVWTASHQRRPAMPRSLLRPVRCCWAQQRTLLEMFVRCLCVSASAPPWHFFLVWLSASALSSSVGGGSRAHPAPPRKRCCCDASADGLYVSDSRLCPPRRCRDCWARRPSWSALGDPPLQPQLGGLCGGACMARQR